MHIQGVTRGVTKLFEGVTSARRPYPDFRFPAYPLTCLQFPADGARVRESHVDPGGSAQYRLAMNAVEFTIELSGSGVLKIPSEAAAQLPKFGTARVIVLTQ